MSKIKYIEISSKGINTHFKNRKQSSAFRDGQPTVPSHDYFTECQVRKRQECITKSLTEEEDSKNLGRQWGTAKSKKASRYAAFFL